ncbi:MAG: hypothetical protein WBQ68_03875, partial [Terriglobales bacterium]
MAASWSIPNSTPGGPRIEKYAGRSILWLLLVLQRRGPLTGLLESQTDYLGGVLGQTKRANFLGAE